MAVFDSTIQKLFEHEFRASEIMKTDGIRKQAIGNYFYGFVQWVISKQGRNIKATILDKSCCNTNPLPPNSVLPREISIEH